MTRILWNRVILAVILVVSATGYFALSASPSPSRFAFAHDLHQIPFVDCDNIGCWMLPATTCRITQDAYWCSTTGGGGSGVKPL